MKKKKNKRRYTYAEKFTYYNGRRMLKNLNKAAYADGFIDDALNHSSRHQHERDIAERNGILKEYKSTRNKQKRSALSEQLSYLNGNIAGWKANSSRFIGK